MPTAWLDLPAPPPPPGLRSLYTSAAAHDPTPVMYPGPRLLIKTATVLTYHQTHDALVA